MEPVWLVSAQTDMVEGKQLSSDIRSLIISKHEAVISYENICEQLNLSSYQLIKKNTNNSTANGLKHL